MKGTRGPFQTSITINVQNLVVTSPDVGRVLRWDPEKGIADTSFSYNIECAQRKQVQVTVRIYDMNRNLVYELTEQKICPGSYSFTWDGTVNTGYYEYPPDEGSNIAPSGLYTFDVEVIANPYDKDAVRSQALTVVPGPVEYFGYDDGGTPEDESDDNYLYYLRWYALYSGRDASYGEIWLYDPELDRVEIWIVPMLQCVVHEDCDGLTANPNGEIHGVIIPVPVRVMEKPGTYRFVLHFYDNYADSYKNHQVKPALEVNQMVTWLPIIYIHGTYENTPWHGAWCNNLAIINKETFYIANGIRVVPHDTDPGFVRGATPDRSGFIRAGVNGGLFDLYTHALVGHVGIGSSWTGNDIRRHRWGYGMRLQGADFLIERMVPTGTGYYTIPPGVRNYPYGLTGIGCLIRAGTPEVLDNQDNWPGGTLRDARTLIAWDQRNFFLIVCEREDTDGNLQNGYERGWTWQHTINFLTQELPTYMRNNWRINVRIQGAMMLDGGGSTQFLYRCAPRVGNGWEEGEYSALRPPRRVPTLIHSWATGLYQCAFPGHRH
ncbi:MAG: hypothetical protein DFNUSKGM_003193 [Candidatus Fervidibacter sacchari]